MDLRILVDLLNEIKPLVNELDEYINITELKSEISDLETSFSVDGFWDDHSKVSEVTSRLSSLKNKLELYEECNDMLSEIEIAIEILGEDLDVNMYEDTKKELNSLSSKILLFRNALLLNGKYDSNNALMEIHAGAGGTESQDWVDMLYRMYMRYFDQVGFKVKVISHHAGEPVGTKSVSVEVTGADAYGLLKGEKGVHRLIRISPFDSSGKRHTSFASVHLSPILENIEDIEIAKSDLKIDTFRASGAGGQSVNTTDSAVRITHLPTGIVVSCQNERSQMHNKEYAMRLLKNKLLAKQEEERQSLIDNNNGEQSDNSWGSQIRSYVFHPYSMVKDHRTNYEVGNAKAVLDGDIQEFILKYLEFSSN